MTLLFFACGKFFVFYPILRLCPVLWEFRCFQVIAFSKQETEIIELLNFNFTFGNLFNSNEIKIIILNCFDCFLIFKILGKYHSIRFQILILKQGYYTFLVKGSILWFFVLSVTLHGVGATYNIRNLMNYLILALF